MGPELGDGFPEWTELGQDSGLDPLGMQRPIEAIYQSIVPGISTITLRYRYYSFFSFILKHYEERIRDSDPIRFRKFHRRCEALYALICTIDEPELGITGSDWATRTLNRAQTQSDENATMDFGVGADPDAEESLRYLRNKAGAFAAIYATQMSEMGLIHFARPGALNPNPICSTIALELADAFSKALGTTAEAFFEIVREGKVTLQSLRLFEAMKPRNLKHGSDEHRLLANILLGRSQNPSESDVRRRGTLRMLLNVISLSKTRLSTEHIKWHWFENVSELHGGDAKNVSHLWFLFQTCDLVRLAYEVILSAALTLIKAAPGQRLSLIELTNELTGFVQTGDDRSWEDFALAFDEQSSSIRELADAMLRAHHQGDVEDQVQLAITLMATLFVRSSEAETLVKEVLNGPEHFQSLRTEMVFLDRVRISSSNQVISDLIRERILKRHLWVATRKFRNQKAYTFHMEPEEGQLRYRSRFQVSPSSPRIDQASRFLEDIGLLDKNGITSLGQAEMAQL